jgi:hypothetical protein
MAIGVVRGIQVYWRSGHHNHSNAMCASHRASAMTRTVAVVAGVLGIAGRALVQYLRTSNEWDVMVFRVGPAIEPAWTTLKSI